MFSLAAALGRPLYIPFGSYIITRTIKVFQKHTLLLGTCELADFFLDTQRVGGCWRVLGSTGSERISEYQAARHRCRDILLTLEMQYFSDLHNPKVMVQVGEWSETGSVEIQDLMLTVEGPTAGVILMEWNMAQELQGSAAMWGMFPLVCTWPFVRLTPETFRLTEHHAIDTHFRIGGAKGLHLTAADCPKLTGSVNPNCVAGSMMLHLTESSSAYLENVWAWVADHDFDSGPAQTQIDIYVARGKCGSYRGQSGVS